MLEQEQVIKMIKNKVDVSEASTFQAWLQSHTEISELKQKVAKQNLLKLARALKLPSDKVEVISNSAVAPFPSTEIVQESNEKLQGVLNGRNASRHISGTTPAAEAEAWKWLSENNIIAKFKTKAWELFKKAPNSLVVIDAPEAGGDPYITYRDISKLCFFEWENPQEPVLLKVAIFQQTKDLYLVYTDEEYGKLENVSSTSIENWQYSAMPHGLNRCPVSFFYQETADSSQPWLKQTPVFNFLSNLDRFNYNHAALFNQNATSISPILEVLEQSCGYSRSYEGENNEIVTEYCEGGRLNVDGIEEGKPCPSCQGRPYAGAGTVIIKPIPREGESEITNAADFKAPSISDVEYQLKKLREDHNRFVISITGKSSQLEERVAINRDQVFSNREAHQAISRNISKNLSYIESFSIDTLLKLRYSNNNITYIANYGTEFYSHSTLELIEMIKAAKETNATALVEALEIELNEQINANNPERAIRRKILDSAEPFKGVSNEDAKAISQEAYLSRILFPVFVRDYENDFGTIGANSIEDTRAFIADFKNKFNTYLQTFLSKNEPVGEIAEE